MSSLLRPRRPFSTRHAFALAFDLAVRRDPLHSLVIPLVLRAPWVLALVLLPPISESGHPGRIMLLTSVALVGLSVTWWAVDAMLRFRARSAFNTPLEARLAPVIECYAKGLRRLPWLYVTEFVRNVALGFAFPLLILPGVFLSYQLAFATEAVVLDDRNLFSAFRHSFHLSRGRFERWLEMIVASVVLVFATLFLVAAVSLGVGRLSLSTWGTIGFLLVAAMWPVIQYAWTFFYLRLVEVEGAAVEVGPAYADLSVGATGVAHLAEPPRLALMESAEQPAAPAARE